MKTTEEIIGQYEGFMTQQEETLYGIGDIRLMLKEYAKEVLDEFVNEIVSGKRGIYPLEGPLGEYINAVPNLWGINVFKGLVIDQKNIDDIV